MNPIERIDEIIDQLKSLYNISRITINTPEYNSFHKKVTELLCDEALEEEDEAGLIYQNLIFKSIEILTVGEADIILKNLQHLRVKLLIRKRKSKNKYDVFVSHATDDKDRFVNELVVQLHNVTSDVWYDKKMIKWGNDIKGKIFEGLEKCEFGIVVFSKSFIGRQWTEEELKILLGKQNENKKEIVLPILLNDLSVEEFKQAYPSLSNVLFVKESDHDIKGITIMFAERMIDRLKNR